MAGFGTTVKQGARAAGAVVKRTARAAGQKVTTKNLTGAAKTAGLVAAAGLGGYAIFKPKEVGNGIGNFIGDIGGGVASGTGKVIGAGVGSVSGSFITSLAESFGITAKQLKLYITIAVILVLVGFTAKLVL